MLGRERKDINMTQQQFEAAHDRYLTPPDDKDDVEDKLEREYQKADYEMDIAKDEPRERFFDNET